MVSGLDRASVVLRSSRMSGPGDDLARCVYVAEKGVTEYFSGEYIRRDCMLMPILMCSRRGRKGMVMQI